MQYSKKGYTLAEMLLALLFISAVVAIILPSLILNINKARYSVVLKKNMGILNSALRQISLDMTVDTSDSGITGDEELANLFIYGHPSGKQANIKPYLNITKINAATGQVYLADGTYLDFHRPAACKSTGDPAAESSSFDVSNNCYVVIDVNGSKTPNGVSTDTSFKDIYVLGITNAAVSPVSLTATNADFVDTAGNNETISAPNNASIAVMLVETSN